MEELELATRFSLKSVLLARLCLVGSLHAVLLLCLTLLCRGTGAASFGRTVVYLLVPYLLTAYGGCGCPAGCGGGRWSMGRRCWQYW